MSNRGLAGSTFLNLGKNYRSLSLKTPMRVRIVFSQLSAMAATILGSICAFSLITPSHKEMPSLMDCLVKIEKGMPTRCCTIAH